MTKEEALAELKQLPEYTEKNKFKDVNNLSKEEERILSDFMDKRRKENESAGMMSGILKGAGPLMQKTMQGMPVTSLPSFLRQAVKDMKSNLSPIPEEIVKAQMAGIVERSKGVISHIEVIKSLGAASVGQAFLCKITGKSFPAGKSVVVKLLRPDVINRMKREEPIMKECAKKTDAAMEQTYEGQLQSIRKELDLTLEAKNVGAGKVYDNRHSDVESMKLNNIEEPMQDVLIAELAEGTSVDKYLEEIDNKIEEIKSRFYTKKVDKDGTEHVEKHMNFSSDNMGLIKQSRDELQAEIKRLEKMRNHVCNLADIWVRQGMLEEGYYHADLHSGNIMISEEKATVIDFGNAVVLSAHQKKWIMGMLTAAMSGDPELFTEAFEELLEKKTDEAFMEDYNKKKASLKTAFSNILSKGDETDAGKRIVVALMRAQELGVEIPGSIYNFAQGQNRLTNTIDEMNARLKELHTNLTELSGISPETSADVNAMYIVQRHVSRFSASGDEVQKNIYQKAIKSLEPVTKEEILQGVLDTSKRKATKEKPAMDMLEEFEKKYIKDYKYLRHITRGKKAFPLPKGDKNSSKIQDDPFNPKEVARKVKEYIAKYKDKKDSPEQIDAGNSFIAMLDKLETDFLEPFGGTALLKSGFGSSLIRMDVDVLEQVIEVLEHQMPIAERMMDKYDELRAAQKRNAPNVQTLAEEFAALYYELGKAQTVTSELITGAKASLDRETVRVNRDNVIVEMDARPEIEKELQGMFAETHDGQGAAMKTAFDNYRKFKALHDKGIPFAPADKELYGAESVEEAMKKAEKDYLDAYRNVALHQLKQYSETTFANKIEGYKDRDFLDVMSTILKEKWTMIKTGFKVGFHVGWKMLMALYSSDSNKSKTNNAAAGGGNPNQNAGAQQAGNQNAGNDDGNA